MKRLTYFATAVLAAGGFGMLGCEDRTTETRTPETAREQAERAADRTGAAVERGMERTGEAVDRAADRTGAAVDRARDEMAQPPATQPGAAIDQQQMNDARRVLAEAVDASFTRGGFDDLVERFSEADRTRIGEFAEKEFQELDNVIAQIQQAWQSKYNQEFKLETKQQQALQYLQFRGEARLAGERTAPADQQQQQADRQQPMGATIHGSASHGLPDFSLDLVREGVARSWRINVPDSLTGQQLHDRLLTHMKQLHQHKDQWPQDVNQAYQIASHHIFVALSGEQMEARPAGERMQGQGY